MTDATTATDEGPVTIQPAGEDPGHTIPAPLNEHVAAKSYRAARRNYIEAFARADLLSRDGLFPVEIPRWRAALVERDAAFEAQRFAQARLRESLLAIGFTESQAARRRAELERSG